MLSDVRDAFSKVKATDGEIAWTIELPRDAPWRASPTVADGRVYFISHRGELMVVDADSGKVQQRLLLADEDADQIRSSVVVAHGAVFVRVNDALYCFKKKAGAKSDHPSLVSEVIAAYNPPVPERQDAKAMMMACQRFLASLDGPSRAKAKLPIDSAERGKWSNLPSWGEMGGLKLGDCNAEQIKRACDLLRATMSERGYQKMRNIMLADDRLLQNGEPRKGFGAEEFWIAIFGEPSANEPWSLQLDGHHIGVNLSVLGDLVSLSPSFIGTQPSAFKLDGATLRPMGGEEDEAFKLVMSLSDEQRSRAVINDERGRIASGPGQDGVVPARVGLPCAELNEAQRSQLMGLIDHYVGDLPAAQAKRRMAELAAEIDHMHFAWSGPTVKKSDISYRIQGPSLIIEYACQDLGGSPARSLAFDVPRPDERVRQASDDSR